MPHRNNRTTCPTYVFIVWKEGASLPAIFNLLCSSTNQQLLKRTFEIRVATMKITDDFRYEWMPSCTYHKIYTFRGEWDTKEALVSPHCMYSGVAKGIDLKACLGLFLPAPSSFRKFVTNFRCIYFVVCSHDLLSPYYEPLLWFMITLKNTRHPKFDLQTSIMTM